MRNLPLILTTVDTVKSKVKISQNFVAFSEYMKFIIFKCRAVVFGGAGGALAPPEFRFEKNLPIVLKLLSNF